MSSFMAFRYIERKDKDFFEGCHHRNIEPLAMEKKQKVYSAKEIGNHINDVLQRETRKKGIMLSGGMDSAILASYMPGCDAYTFRFLGGDYQKEELNKAERYASQYGLKLHYVDIDWTVVTSNLDSLMKSKAAPVHSIEPQILQAALQAKKDNVEVMVIGESSDLIFGGMDQLLAKDWDYEEFKKRYIFTGPQDVLIHAVDMNYLFERYRMDANKINFLKFLDDVFSIESSSSYMNAFLVANLPYVDPYADMIMGDELDLRRVRNGEPKYLIRELFAMRYPDIPIPDKTPMPRPVDAYFKNWNGPSRPEFKQDLDMSQFTGNQKWQMYCLECFLNLYEK